MPDKADVLRSLSYKGKVAIVEILSVFLTYLWFVTDIVVSDDSKSVNFSIANRDKKMTAVGRIAYSDAVWSFVPVYLAGFAVVFSKLGLDGSFFTGDKVADWKKLRSLSASSGVDSIMESKGATRSHQSLAVKYLLGDLFRDGSENSSVVKDAVGKLDF